MDSKAPKALRSTNNRLFVAYADDRPILSNCWFKRKQDALAFAKAYVDKDALTVDECRILAKTFKAILF